VSGDSATVTTQTERDHEVVIIKCKPESALEKLRGKSLGPVGISAVRRYRNSLLRSRSPHLEATPLPLIVEYACVSKLGEVPSHHRTR
jgi:hypothetical protein